MGLHPAMIRSALLVLVSVTLCSAACYDGWKAFEGSCYKEFEETYMINQIDAEISCVSKGGHLVTIKSIEEAAFNSYEVMSYEFYDTNLPWIGLQYNPSTNVSSWTDGSPLGNYVWGMDGPPYYPGDMRNQCVQLTSLGHQPVSPCAIANTNRYICEGQEFETTTTVSTTTTTPACPSNAAHFNTIVRGGLNRFWRTYNWLLRYHQYNTVLNAAKNNGQHWEGDVGYYVNHTTYQQLKRCCPKLREMKLMQNKAQPQISHITPYLTWTHPNWFHKANKFYCAPSKNYCGANFELVEIHKAVGSGEHLDAFIPHSDYERNLVLSNKFPKYKNHIARSICWVWQTPGRY